MHASVMLSTLTSLSLMNVAIPNPVMPSTYVSTFTFPYLSVISPGDQKSRKMVSKGPSHAKFWMCTALHALVDVPSHAWPPVSRLDAKVSAIDSAVSAEWGTVTGRDDDLSQRAGNDSCAELTCSCET
eukprot:scaffold358061_cov41-Attheya_sp.AAC.1